MDEQQTWTRVHEALDRDLEAAQLSDVERAQLARLEPPLHALARALHDAPAPDLSAAVMQRIAGAAPAQGRTPAAALRSLLGWFWTARPLTLAVRPAYGLALLVLLAAGLQLLATRAQPVPHAAARATVFVQFRVELPDARQVALAGTFTGWEPRILLEQVSPGVWAALVPLQPGVHDYTFVVDGDRWVVDPHAPQVDDDFGGRNNRLPVPSPLQGS